MLRTLKGLDEVDLSILEALVLQPRASWSLIGSVLEMSPSTASRRWEAMRESGIAWMSCYPGADFPHRTHTFEVVVRCAPERIASIAAALAQHPVVMSLVIVSGDWDLQLTCMIVDGTRVQDFLLEDIWDTPGIVRRKASVATELFAEGRDWKLGALSAQESQLLRKTPRGGATSPEPGELQLGIMSYLQEDPRMKALHIADRLGASVATVSRHIEQLISGGQLVLRTEVSSRVEDWPISVGMYVDVPAAALGRAGRLLAGLANCRLSMSVLAPGWNLASVHWLRTHGEVHEIERRLQEEIPQARVVTRSFRLTEVKRAGWLLDEQMAPTSRVPMRLSSGALALD